MKGTDYQEKMSAATAGQQGNNGPNRQPNGAAQGPGEGASKMTNRCKNYTRREGRVRCYNFAERPGGYCTGCIVSNDPSKLFYPTCTNGTRDARRHQSLNKALERRHPGQAARFVVLQQYTLSEPHDGKATAPNPA